MRIRSIPRQLLLLVSSSVVVTVLVSGAFYAILRQSLGEASSLTRTTVAGLDVSYELLARLSTSQSSIQNLLRQKDPDEIEKGMKTVQEAQEKVAALIGSAGENGRPILAPFNTLVGQQKAVLELLLMGNNGLAYEKFLTAYNPQYESVLKEVEACSIRVQEATVAKMSDQEKRVQAALRWRLAGIATLLLALAAAGWRLKRRITVQLEMITGKLRTVSDTVTGSAAQISSASQSLAEGASEQAASLEETGASLEEMASMTQRNAGGAETAKDLANQTRAAAEAGARDMQTMSEAMGAIHASSNNIAKIIKTIDEIAFQTNILALNAAVEAARAGEAGMGFAVVADEVRSLAQRCAQAARETTEKIEDSVAKSERGVQINERVAQGLAEIVEKTRRVDQLVAEIAAASKEQSQGIEQVNTAVSQMDKVTQSNAANAEETAAAAGEMNGQMTALQQAVMELHALTSGSTDQALDTPRRGNHEPREYPVHASTRSPSALPQRVPHRLDDRHTVTLSAPSEDSGTSKALVHWNGDLMSTGVDSVDAQHQELIRRINELHAACIEGRGREELLKILAFLGQYAKEHFAEEEALMEQHRCSVRGQNKAAHIQFLKTYEKLVEEVKTDGVSTSLLLKLKEMVGDWLVNHICSVDTRLRECKGVSHLQRV